MEKLASTFTGPHGTLKNILELCTDPPSQRTIREKKKRRAPTQKIILYLQYPDIGFHVDSIVHVTGP